MGCEGAGQNPRHFDRRRQRLASLQIAAVNFTIRNVRDEIAARKSLPSTLTDDAEPSTPIRTGGCANSFVAAGNSGPKALFERHFLFDSVTPASQPQVRVRRFEAFARSVRDVLSQRWIRTEETYERKNPKRVYYLSMEFLIGRSLANNIANLAA